MIARLTGDAPSCWTAHDEASLRQCGQFAAYGADTPFLGFYEDDHGNRLTVLDGAAVLCAVDNAEDMRLFLTMDSTVSQVRTDCRTAALLAADWETSYATEAVMEAPKNASCSDVVQDVLPKEVYDVLVEGFGADVLAPFDVWYADVHHRYRRGLCRIVGVVENGEVVATAMTVAECGEAALIGAVATRAVARGKGYASACVLTLASRLQNEGKRVLLSPKNEYAHRLYERIGFNVVGEWGSVKKPVEKG